MAAGVIAKIFLQNYDFLSDGISIFSTLWIVAGCCLLLVSIFGIAVSFGSSTILVNGVSEIFALHLILHNTKILNLCIEFIATESLLRKKQSNFWSFFFTQLFTHFTFQSMPFY